MKLSIFIVCTLLFWYPGRTLGQASRDARSPCGLVEQALAAYREIKPDNTRREVEKNFDYDGGIHFRDHGRYTYRGCNYLKLEVDFHLAPDTGKVPNSVNDTVTTVSKLFIDYPSKD
jgi:hypothetical protein